MRTDLSPEAVEIARAVAGDEEALELALRRVEPELRASISIQPLWRRSLDADDVLQVSFLEAFLRVGTLRDATPGAFRAWMRRIVQNNLRDAVRALERDKRPDPRKRQTRGTRDESARTLLGRLGGGAATASGPAILKEDVDRLLDALARLPRSYRRVVELMDLDERAVAEVARELERSHGAVHLLRSRAHDRLREVLQG